jgi:hypothetical protein
LAGAGGIEAFYAAGTANMKSRIMYIEPGGGLAGAGGRIGRVQFSKTGKTLRYGARSFQSLDGRGYKENYCDINSGERYWISGPRRDGNDALYPMVVEIDDDVREEYWCQIRELPDFTETTSFRSPGKYSRKKPRPELSVKGGTKSGTNRGGSGVMRR